MACALLLLPVSSWLGASFSGSDVFVPSVARGAGSTLSQWYTTLWVYNPSSTPVNVQFFFLERNKPNPSPAIASATVQGGDTYRVDNAVETLFHLVDKYGAIRVVANEKVIVNARTYSKPPGGEEKDTVGQFFAAIPAGFAVGAGQTTQLLGVYQTSPQADSQYRYNVGFVEVTGNGCTIQVKALDVTGWPIASKDYTLGGLEPRQVNINEVMPGINATNLRIEISVIAGAGRVVAFGSGTANRSNDPSTFEMSFRDELLVTGSSGGLSVVSHDSTLSGDGTSATPLGVAAGGITKNRLAASGGDPGMVLGTDGKDLVWWFPERGGLTWPFKFSGSDAGALFAITNGGTGIALDGRTEGETGIGVRGIASSHGTAINRGGYFESYGTNGRGVEAATNGVNGWAVYGLALGDWGRGVFGEARSGAAVGVQGKSTTGDGVVGTSDASTKSGVYGVNTKVDGYGVFGRSGSTPGVGRGYAAGVGGDGGSTGAGVAGTTSATGGIAAVEGSHWNSRAYGALGTESIGVIGEKPSGGTRAGYFNGDVEVTGTLKKGGGAFRIDHPLDPAGMVLQHSFVESPDMLNVYNGVAVLDQAGAAVVELPVYFEALNRDFRYQLTCIGGFAPVFIAEEVHANRFAIGGGRPGLRVSWQVTGIRQDPWANEYRIVVEEAKSDGERGRYLHPGVYGQPEEKGISRIVAPARALGGHDQSASKTGGQP